MFKSTVKFMFAAAILFIGVSAANAQIANGSQISVNVPSDFILKDKTFAAGNYTIERTPSTIDSPSLLILRGEGETMIFDTMTARTNGTATDTQLVFDTVDGLKYLSAIQVKGQNVTSEIAKTKKQTRMMANASAGRFVLTITDTSF
jgi:hypothetical protein